MTSVRVAEQDLGRQHKIGKDTVTLVRSICFYSISLTLSLLFILIYVYIELILILLEG